MNKIFIALRTLFRQYVSSSFLKAKTSSISAKDPRSIKDTWQKFSSLLVLVFFFALFFLQITHILLVYTDRQRTLSKTATLEQNSGHLLNELQLLEKQRLASLAFSQARPSLDEYAQKGSLVVELVLPPLPPFAGIQNTGSALAASKIAAGTPQAYHSQNLATGLFKHMGLFFLCLFFLIIMLFFIKYSKTTSETAASS